MKPVILLTAFLIFFLSCQKAENHSCVGCYHPTPLTTLPPTPYDKSNVAGCFICQKGNNNNNGDVYFFVAFFDQSGSQKNGIPNVLFTNDSLITYFGSITAFNGCYFFYSKFQNDSIMSWRILDTTTFSFTFTDTNTPPYINIISDTLTSNNDTALLINSFTNTDSIGVTINDSLHYYTVASDTIHLSLVSYGIATGTRGNIPLSITAYKHQYHTINGFRYLFIKEYVVQQNVWLK